MSSTIVTVSQLCRYVQSLLEEQKPLADLLVKGELSNLSYRSSGHLYFSLCDEGALMKCVMFSRYAQKLSTLPQDGSLVVVRGTVNLYERDGSFQLLAYDLQELGAGVQQQSLDELKRRLQREGLFAPQRKRALPTFPRAVGVITSAQGAALQDIITTFGQLNPLVRLVVYPATVQGTGAAASVTAALHALEAQGRCDSCVIARGGGSSEDLSAFNDEGLARAVAACPIPVVSAVGHEVDYSILDLVADARAATPTAACRLLAAPVSLLYDRIIAHKKALARAMDSRLERSKGNVTRLQLLLATRSPENEIKKNRQNLDYLIKSLQERQCNRLEKLRSCTVNLMERLELVGPIQLLRRGYSITTQNEDVVKSCKQLAPGDELRTRLLDGDVVSSVIRIEERAHECG